MKSLEIAEATAPLADYVRDLGKEPLILSVKGTTVAVLVPIADLETLPLNTHSQSLSLLDKSRSQQKLEATAPLADCVRNLGKEPAIVNFDGKPIAALVAIADYETVSLSNNPQFLALIERSRSRQKAEGGVSSNQLRQRLGLEPKANAQRKLL